MKVLNSPPISAHLWRVLQEVPYNLKGSNRLRSLLKNRLQKGLFCFPWRMLNNLQVGISNVEIFAPCGVGPACFKQRSWEHHVEACLRKHLRPNMVALDIGANIGYFSAVMATCVGRNGHVSAFEPIPATTIQLELTKSSNSLLNLQIFQRGLGEKISEEEIVYNLDLSANASLYSRPSLETGNRIKIPIDTLDSMYKRGEIKKCDFIKIDVEGHEVSVFRGGGTYLKESQPIMLCEYNQETASAAGYTFADLSVQLSALFPSSKKYLVWGDGHLIHIDSADLQIPSGCHIDFLLVPSGRELV